VPVPVVGVGVGVTVGVGVGVTVGVGVGVTVGVGVGDTVGVGVGDTVGVGDGDAVGVPVTSVPVPGVTVCAKQMEPIINDAPVMSESILERCVVIVSPLNSVKIILMALFRTCSIQVLG